MIYDLLTLGFLGILITIIIYDYKYLIIPNELIFLLLIIGSIGTLLNIKSLTQYLIGILFGFGLFFLL